MSPLWTIVAAPWQGASASTGGIVAFLVGTVSFGASFAYMGKFLAGRGIPPLTLAHAQLTAASGLLLVAMPFTGLQPVHLRTDSLVAMAVLGEPAGWPLYTGAIVSVAGVMLVRRKPVASGCGRPSDHNHSRALNNA